MKETYSKIWDLAKPYYEQGRPMDIDHIEWMMEEALLLCEEEQLDDTLLLPLVILHDVGYAEVEHGNPYRLDLRKAHMKAGAKIAKKLLSAIDYPDDKIEKIAYYVSVHDNWALKDFSVYEDKLLASFQDLDFMWMATRKGFPAMMKIQNFNESEMIHYIETDDKHTKQPFATTTARTRYEMYLEQRRKETN